MASEQDFDPGSVVIIVFTLHLSFEMAGSGGSSANEALSSSYFTSQASSSNIPTLPQNPTISVKLTDINFLMWQHQVEATVWGYGLESFLTREEPAPD